MWKTVEKCINSLFAGDCRRGSDFYEIVEKIIKEEILNACVDNRRKVCWKC